VADTAKTLILKTATGQGHSDSYGALLHLTASMEFDPKALVPESDEETNTWHGHMLGMRAALHCLAMHEQKYGPELAGVVVDRQIVQAIAVMRRFAGEAEG
jgi:hypothetical protein